MGKIYGENLREKFPRKISGENFWGKFPGKISGKTKAKSTSLLIPLKITIFV
jgi:hypothetical protein